LLTSAALLIALVPVAAAVLPEALSRGLTRAWPPVDVSWPWVASALIAAALVAALATRGLHVSAVSAVALSAAANLFLLKLTVFPDISRQAGTRELWQQVEPQQATACIGDVRRHVLYGLRYYGNDRLPDCSVGPRPVRIEGDPPHIVSPAGRTSP